jgi:hypothetical protein
MAPTWLDFFFGGSSVPAEPVTEAPAPVVEVTGVIVAARVVSLVVSMLVLGGGVDELDVVDVNGRKYTVSVRPALVAQSQSV